MSQRGSRGQVRGGGRGGGAPRGGGPQPVGRGAAAGSGGAQASSGGAVPGFSPSAGGARGGYQPRGGGPSGGRGGGRGGVPGINAAGQPAQLDARLTNSDQADLVASFRAAPPVADKTNIFPLRPDWGTKGKEVTLRANHFPIVFSDNMLYNYKIVITPAVADTQKRLRRRIIQLAEATPEFQTIKLHVAHDFSKRLISAKEIPEDAAAFSIAYFDEEQGHAQENSNTYTVELEFEKEMDPSELRLYLSGDLAFREFDTLPVISALNIVLAQKPTDTGVKVGQNRYFFPSHERMDLGGGLEAWRGYFSSVRPLLNQLSANINVSATPFYKEGNLAAALMAAGPDAVAHGFGFHLRVECTYLGYPRRYTITKIGKNPPSQQEFACAEFGPGKISVAEYFRRRHNITLGNPNIPVVNVAPTNRSAVWIPPELFRILPNQHFHGKLSDKHTAEMITFACQPPNVNAQAIVGTGIPALGFHASDPAPVLEQFGVSVGNEMAVVPGRVLAPPGIAYSGQGRAKIQNGGWNLRDVKFAKGAALLNWAVLAIRDGGREDFQSAADPALLSIVKGLANMCRTSGMNVDKKDPVIAMVDVGGLAQRSQKVVAISQAIHQHFRSVRPKIIIVMLSNADKYVYAGIKKECDIVRDTLCVCAQIAKIRKEKGQPQYFANLALKINAKLGGINHVLEKSNLVWLQKEPTMFMGSDVTHPGPDSMKGTPSIAAVVGSVDEGFCQYPASLRIQEGKEEMIIDLTEMAIERILAFKAQRNLLPTRILFIRDGVSEGQYESVKAYELVQLQAAFPKLGGPTYRPKVSFLIAGKRHHTRFYPTKEDEADQKGNCKPGTVVDRGVTTVFGFDFFIQPHAGLQGTTRPTHYYVVHDENKLTADIIQTVTNDTSYLFARATRAVSLAPPAYYADLACERGRCYLYDLLNAGDRKDQFSKEDVKKRAAVVWGRGIGPTVGKAMFYI